MSAELEELYQDLIIDHYKNPRCAGCITDPDASVEVSNPLCGDRISLCLSCDNNRLNEVRFCGKGCSISQASASMMAEACRGKSLDEVIEFSDKFRAFMRGERDVKELEALGSDLVALQGVRKFSARIKCALLAWDAMRKCIDEIGRKGIDELKSK